MTKTKKKSIDYVALAYDFLDKNELGQGGEPLAFKAWKNEVYAYQGTHWQLLPDYVFEGLLRDYFRERDADDALPGGLSLSNGTVANVISTIKPIISVAWFRNDFPPFWLHGQKGAPRNIIAFQNGLLDLTTGLTRPHDEEFFCLSCLPYNYDSQATCPRWLQFLTEIYEGDTERINLLQEWFGYCLTYDTSRHKFLTLVGQLRSGKSTIEDVLRHLIGLPVTTAFKIRSLASRFGVAQLEHKRVATIEEANLEGCKERSEIYEMLNRIIGGTFIPVEKKGKDPYDAEIYCKLVMSCNAMPHFFDGSTALTARMLFINHDVSFLGREDVTLKDKLLAELAGIANWALAGLARLTQQGFTLPARSKEALMDYACEVSPKAQFIKECLLVSKSVSPSIPGITVADVNDENLLCPKSRVADAWVAWASERDLDSGLEFFWKDFRHQLPRVKDFRPRVDGKPGQRYLKGVTLRHPWDKVPERSAHVPNPY